MQKNRKDRLGEESMKKMKWITGVLTALMVLLAALGAVGVAVGSIAGDAALYGAQSRQAVMQANGFAAEDEVTAYIGMDAAQQQEMAGALAQYMAGDTQALPEGLNENEQAHLRDVRSILSALGNMSRAYLTIAVALAVVTAWTAARLQKYDMSRIVGSLVAVSIIMLLVVGVNREMAASGFETMFVQMHEVLFDNDLWRMTPETDVLIRMMPMPLFEQAALNVAAQALRVLAVTWAALLAVHELLLHMIRRHAAKR